MRNVEDRRRVIRDLKKAIRRKEIENKRMDIDLEEMAIKVAERQNVSNPNGKFGLKNIGLYRMESRRLITSFLSIFPRILVSGLKVLYLAANYLCNGF